MAATERSASERLEPAFVTAEKRGERGDGRGERGIFVKLGLY